MLRTIIFRIIQIILGIAGTVLYLNTEYNHFKWTQNFVFLGLGGYTFILTVCLLTSFLEPIPYLLEVVFLIIGFLLNFCCGILLIVSYSMEQKHNKLLKKEDPPDNMNELILGIICMCLGIIMLLDVLTGSISWEYWEEED